MSAPATQSLPTLLELLEAVADELDRKEEARAEVVAFGRQHIHPELEAALANACAEHGIDWIDLFVQATCDCLYPGTRH